MPPTPEQVAERLLDSRRYRTIAPSVALRIAERELRAAGGSLEDAVKRGKRRLHQVYGAFMPAVPRYAQWRAALAQARGDSVRMRRTALGILTEHASTRERARELPAFYAALFSRVPPPARVLDAGCGLHPLAAPWMPLPERAEYLAFDIDVALIDFVGAALNELGLRAQAFVADLARPPALPPVDLALLLKTLPCLEADQGPAALDAIEALPARVVAVSFPAHSLGGRRRLMGQNHAARFEEAAARRGWSGESFECAGEVVFLVRTGNERGEPQESRA